MRKEMLITVAGMALLAGTADVRAACIPTEDCASLGYKYTAARKTAPVSAINIPPPNAPTAESPAPLTPQSSSVWSRKPAIIPTPPRPAPPTAKTPAPPPAQKTE